MFGGVAAAGLGRADEEGSGGRVLSVDQDGDNVVWRVGGTQAWERSRRSTAHVRHLGSTAGRYMMAHSSRRSTPEGPGTGPCPAGLPKVSVARATRDDR